MGVEPYLIAAIGALATVVTVLWRVDIGNRDREHLSLRKALDDALTRLTVLEQSRLNAAIQRGDEMKALAERFVRELADNSAVLRGLKDAFDGFTQALTARPCMHDLEPAALEPRPSTETITRKEPQP